MLSDERIEIAKRLRKTRGTMAFVDALGIDFDSDWCWTDVSRRVADLIDPTCHVIDMGWPNDYAVVRECDACGGSWTQDPLSEPYRFCPRCGARVVSEHE